MDKKATSAAPVQAKDKWKHQAESTLSLLGYAVGLGNFWRFPYLCMRNGGGAFIIPYMVFLVLCGLPLFYLELSLSQFSALGPITVWEICPLFKGVGIGMVLISAICSTYFITVITWGVYYLVMSLRRDVPWRTCHNTWNTPNCFSLSDNLNQSLINETMNYFVGNGTVVDSGNNDTSVLGRKTATEEFWNHKVLGISDGIEHIGKVKWDMALCFLATWVLVWLCLCKGIRSSGKAVYVTVPLPFIMLTVLVIRGVTLPGSLEGIKFYMIPDWSKLNNFMVWTDACIQVFYTLGFTWGGLHTFGSYNRFNNNCLRDSLIVSFTCAGTSIYAGIAIFSILGYMAHETGLGIEQVVSQGPGLAFVGYPEALTKLPIAPLWAVCLFLAIISLGIDGEFGMLESVVTGLVDEYSDVLSKRKNIFGTAICFVLCILGLPFITEGGMYIFQLTDWYLSIVALMLFGFIECIVVGYVYGIGRFYGDMTLMSKKRPSYFWAVCWCGVIPVLLLGMLVLNCLWMVPPMYGSYSYPAWAVSLGWCIAMVPAIPVPIVAIYMLIQEKGSFKDRLATLTRPSSKWRPQSANAYLDAYDNDRKKASSWTDKMKASYYMKDSIGTATENIPLANKNVIL